MSRVGTIARRTFLIGSATIAGGVAFGAYMVNRPIPNPLLDDLAEGEAAITPYVKIDANGITLITPRAEMGQGAVALQANLIAEELDIDPASATLTPGMPGLAYYNAASFEDGAAPGYDDSTSAQITRYMFGKVARLMGIQITGGSSTTPDSFAKLRTAGAVARETLKEAAAQRTGVDRSLLKTKDGHVILPNGEEIAYTALAAEAALIDPVEDVTLRDPSTWRLLGKPDMKRLDMVAKSTGTEIYGIDCKVDGMVFASVCANPAIGGDIISFDATTAKTMPGVQDIVSVSGGVAVIASNTWYAIQAANAVECVWGPGSYPKSSDMMWDVLETAIDNEDFFNDRMRDDGDVAVALETDDLIEAEYRVPYLAHAPMEPLNAIVLVTDTKCKIWSGVQAPLWTRDKAAALTGLAPENVHVYVQQMGGSFGHRVEIKNVEQAVEIAMAVKGTPVKMTWSREEDMTQEFPRPPAIARGRGKVSNGQVDTLDLSVSQAAVIPPWLERNSGIAMPGPDPSIGQGSWDQPFTIPNYRVTTYRVPDMVPVSAWRSVGASGNGFMHDTFMDELIHAAGADPLAERVRLCFDETSRKVIEEVGKISGWDGPSLGENRGRGIAFCMSFGVPVAQVVEVTNTPNGIKIDKAFIVADVGTVLDPKNAEAQLFGGTIYGLGHAINSELTYENYAAQQNNYHANEGLRLFQTPEFEVKILENGHHIRGLGEPGVPPAAPALGNAIFAATGQRIREMPFHKHINFV